MRAMQQLSELREYGGATATVGLDDSAIEAFLANDPDLAAAIDLAYREHHTLRQEFGESLAGAETALVEELQSAYTNFYPPENVNPYVALGAKGPWVVTSHGAVLHDNGGYGMLGMGHAPRRVIDAMVRPYVMANVMTPSFSHARFARRLRAEVGQNRVDGCPFAKFVCMNSGSEAVTVATRIADHNTLHQTGPGGPREGAAVKVLSLRGSFHGRTGKPAQASDSSLPTYRKKLASFSKLRDHLITVAPNDVAALRAAFAEAEREDVFIEMVFLEPVMGEGNPGQPLARDFYDAARELTLAHGSMLLIDSIQAGIRGTGYLSLVDYPGFEDCVVPDMETWSKALNAGQYPLSVLGMSERAANRYATGVYGNTMTTNPRALEVAVEVLDQLTPEIRRNIVERGAQLVSGLEKLKDEFPGVVTQVQGTGLLVAMELDPEQIPVVGFDGIERWCRHHGLGIIHGGKNALRYTPHFGITEAEVELVLTLTRHAVRAKVGLPVEGLVERERVLVTPLSEQEQPGKAG